MTKTLTTEELNDDLNMLKNEYKAEGNREMVQMISDIQATIDSLLYASKECMKQYRATVKNEDTKKIYETVVFAPSEEAADRIVYSIFDDFFYNEETEEQDMYSHSLEEIPLVKNVDDIPTSVNNDMF